MAMTDEQYRQWQRQRKLDILQNQRVRRRMYRRIDYYPSDEAAAVIDALVRSNEADYSRVIDALILSYAESGASG